MTEKQKVDDFYSSFTNEKEIPTLTFDAVLERLGFGWYQVYVFTIVGLIGMCDGGESQAISIVLPILEKEWNISSFDESLLGSLVYVGYLIGSLFSGLVADRIGRRFPILVASLIMTLVAVAGAFMPNFVLYVILRVLLVCCIGFIIPIAFSMLAENTPVTQRGVVLVAIGLFYTSGELLVCLLAWIFMPNLQEGNWRMVLAYSACPAALTVLISVFLLQESPRFYLIEGKADQAQRVIIRIFKMNNKKYEDIPLADYEQMSRVLKEQELQEQGVQEIDKKSNIIQETIEQISKLLSGKFTRITLIIWYQWFTNTFVFAGISFLLPLTLKSFHPSQDDEDNDDLSVIALSCVGELPVIFIAMVIVNIQIFGRKNSLALSYTLVAVLCSLIFMLKNDGYIFSFLVAGSKMCINLSFTISYQFVSEIYPTYMRASGVGFASSVGRTGAIIMPWIVVYINEIGTFLPYSIFGVIALLAGIGTLALPFDTYKRELDKVVK